jgi:VRR-NUC domain
MSEWSLQAACCKYMNHALPPACAWTAIDAAGFQDPIQGAIRRSRGIFSGWPDFILIHAGIFHGIELKSPDGRLSPRQREVSTQILDAGGRYRLVRSVQQLADTLALWGIPCHLGPLAMVASQYDALLAARAATPKPPAKKRRKSDAPRVIARMHAAGLWRP